jgi:hypothetical protein
VPVPEVVVVGTFTTENEPSQGVVTFTDKHFSVDALESEIYTPVHVTGYLDQNGFMRVRLPLNIGNDTIPQPRTYHCVIGVLEYHAEFDFVINPAQTMIDLATLIPVSPVPTLTGDYVASVAGMTGNISAEALSEAVGTWSPAAGDSAYEIWLKAGNTGTINDFFEAYRGLQGVPGVAGPDGGQGPIGPKGLSGPAGPQGDDFEIEGVVAHPSDLPDGYQRYTVFVTSDTKEFWLNTGNDQWMSLGSYAGEPGAPGDVSGGIRVGTNYFISPEPSRLEGWTADIGILELVDSMMSEDRTAIANLWNSDIDATRPLVMTSPPSGTPQLNPGDHLWVQANVYTNLASGDVVATLRRRNNHVELARMEVTGNPAVGRISFGYDVIDIIPAGDLVVTFERTANATPYERMRAGNIMLAMADHETAYFDGSSTNDDQYNYNWVSQEGYSVSHQTTVTTKAILNLDNVDNTHDLDKPISTATQVALDDVRENAGQVKSVNFMVGDVIVDKNSVGLDQVANLAPNDLPVSQQTQLAMDSMSEDMEGLVEGLKLGELADVSQTDAPVIGDVVTWAGSEFEYRQGGNTAVVIPDSVDLNGYTTPGSFVQPATLGAQNGTNYPVGLAGMLAVSASPDAGHVWQRYTVYGRGGAVNTDLDSDVVWQRARYNGVWTLWKPQSWGKPMVWNNAASGWNDVPSFADFNGQNWGGEVYQDSLGRLRTRPEILLYNGITSATLPASWPMGITVMRVSSANGFPGSGNVLTVKGESGEWTMQLWSTGPTSQKVMFRFGSTSWGAWEMIGGPAYSESTPLVAYTGWAMVSSYMQVWGHVAMLYGNIKRTGADLTSPGGNITNTNMCYIVSGLPYPTTTTGFHAVAGGTLFAGQIGSDRVLVVSLISRGSTIYTNDTMSFSSTYLTNQL